MKLKIKLHRHVKRVKLSAKQYVIQEKYIFKLYTHSKERRLNVLSSNYEDSEIYI